VRGAGALERGRARGRLAVVEYASLGEQHEVVERVEHRRSRLVNRAHHGLPVRGELAQERDERERGGGVQPGRGLVHQQQRRSRDEFHRDGESFALAAAHAAPRRAADEPRRDVAEVELREEGLARGRALRVCARAGHAQVRGELERLEHGERGEHEVVLETQPDELLRRGRALAVHEHRAVDVRLVREPGEHGQEARLTAAAGTHQTGQGPGEERGGERMDDVPSRGAPARVSHDGGVTKPDQVHAELLQRRDRRRRRRRVRRLPARVLHDR
jgi:hypothetical protein